MVLLKLFVVFFKIGFFAVGGAYSFLPLVEKEVVQNHAWLNKPEFLEVTGMVELFPGAISVKFATYVGYKIGGVPGALIANVANLLPPVLFMAAASLLYARYRSAEWMAGALRMVRYAVFAMIIGVAVKLVDSSRLLDVKILPVVVVSFLLLTLTRVHPAFMIIGAAIYGGFLR